MKTKRIVKPKVSVQFNTEPETLERYDRLRFRMSITHNEIYKIGLKSLETNK